MGHQHHRPVLLIQTVGGAGFHAGRLHRFFKGGFHYFGQIQRTAHESGELIEQAKLPRALVHAPFQGLVGLLKLFLSLLPPADVHVGAHDAQRASCGIALHDLSAGGDPDPPAVPAAQPELHREVLPLVHGALNELLGLLPVVGVQEVGPAFVDQHAAEALDRHVGQGKQLIEHDAELLAQVLLVGGFEGGLRRRQACALRVVDQVELQLTVRAPVAERVQPPQAFEARIESAFAALPVDVLFQVAGQGGDDLYAMRCQKRGQILEAGLFEDGQVAAVDHTQAARARGDHEAPEIAVQLGGASGQVEGGDLRTGVEKIDGGVHGLIRHFLLSFRPRVYMAVHAALIAAVTQIHLQRFDRAALQARKIGAGKQGQGGVHVNYSGKFYLISRAFCAIGYRLTKI